MLNPKTRNAVYCPVCGIVLFWKHNVLGETIIPEEHFPGGKCIHCGHEIIDTPDPFESFYISNDTWEEEHFQNRKYVLEHYVLSNPEYNRDAHIRRLEMMQENNLNHGLVDDMITREQREILGLEVEDPVPKGPKPNYFKDPPKPSCPRCGSTSISTQKKGFGLGKAVAGVFAIGTAGALAGAAGANKVYNVCQKCGHKWTPGR